MSHGVAATPASTSRDVTSARKASTAPATRLASSSSPRASSLPPAYTGMKEAESTPSPNRFCRKLGMRKAALNASAASDCSPK